MNQMLAPSPSEAVQQFLAGDPYLVQAPSGRVELPIADVAAPTLPADVGLVATTARDKVILRLAGGCGGLEPAVRVELLEYLYAALFGYAGVAFSGGTRDVADGNVVPMITEAAALIAMFNPGVVALGTMPRTKEYAGLVDRSRFVIGQYDTAIHPHYQMVAIVQNGPDGEQDWDGDVPLYRDQMTRLCLRAGFRGRGVIAANGGDATVTEIRLSAADPDEPTFLINGFGRETDRHVGLLLTGELTGRHIVVADRKDPSSLRDALASYGFFPQAA